MKAAALQLNAFTHAIADAAGVAGDSKEDRGQNAALINLLNMSVLLSGSVGGATNVEQHAKDLASQERAIERSQEGFPARRSRVRAR